MKRILQITLLWISGAVLLGHGIIPHHHHHENQEHCASENQDHKHKALAFSDTFACNHADAHKEPCTLDTKTVIKKSQLPSAALKTERLTLSIEANTAGILYSETAAHILSVPLFEHGPSRAPPVA